MAPRLVLDVRLDGFDAPVGYLAGYEGGATRFAYDEAYLGDPRALPLSLSLPLTATPFPDQRVRAFFQNLLPENNQLESVIARHDLARDDVVGLLYHLGSDCPGAISCVPNGAPPAKTPGSLATDYGALPPEELAEIVRRLANHEALPAEVSDPSPVAGVQRKIALTVLPDGSFALPKDGLGAPTTHILKVPYRTRGREARLEEAAAKLARSSGLDVVVPEALEVGGHEVLLIPRFDRVITDDLQVLRVHQEDFVQALGLPSELKYERRGEPGRRFDAQAISTLLGRVADPALAKRDFLMSVFFNMLVGNVDNHGKNHALLYDKGPKPRLAPLYDLLPTRLNKSFVADFAFRIGSAESLEAMRLEDVAVFLTVFGFTEAGGTRFVTDRLVPMIEALEDASLRLPRALKDFDDLIGRETERLVEVLELKMPVRERDYVDAAGG